MAAAAQIRRGLLTTEIDQALTASDGVAALRMLTGLAPLPPLDRPGEDQEHGRAEVEEALRGARPDQVPLLLTVADRHALRPVTANFRGAAYVFAAWWVQQPAPDLEPGRWPAPPEALDWVRDVLRDWLAGPHQAHAVAAVRARWWRPLWQQACDPADDLDAELMSVACRHLASTTRNQLMWDIQEWAFARMAGDTHPSTVAWNIAFGARRPGMSDAAIFLAGLVEHGRTLSPEVGSRLCAVLEEQPALSAEALWTISQLGKLGHPVPPWCAGLGMRDGAVLHTGGLFEVKAPLVVDSLLAAPHDTALAVLGSCADDVAIPLHETLTLRWPRDARTATTDECRAVAFTFVLAHGRPRSDRQRAAFDALLHRLATLVALMPQNVRTAVELSYPGGLGQPWRDWVSQTGPRRWNLRRRSGPGSATKPGKRVE